MIKTFRIAAAAMCIALMAAMAAEAALPTPPPPPQPQMDVTPLPVDFGAVDVGTTGSVLFTVTNNGTLQGTVSGIALTGAYAAEYALVADTCTGVLMQPAVSCTFQVDFTPAAYGSRPVTITVTSDDPITPVNAMAATAVGMSADIVVKDAIVPYNDGALAFGALNPGLSLTRAMRIYNVGNKAMTVGDLTSGGTLPAAPYTLLTDTCSNQSVAPGGANCLVEVKYAPGANGTFATSLAVPTNDPDTPVFTVAISGTGVNGGANTAPPAPLLSNPLAAGSAAQPFSYEWSESHDVDADVVNYKIYVSQDPYFADSMAVEAQVNSVDFVASAASAAGAMVAVLSLSSVGGSVRSRRRTWLIAATLGIAVLVTASCGGSGPSGDTGSRTSSRVTMTLGATAGTPVPASVNKVVMRITGDAMGDMERIMDITDHNTAVSQSFDVPNGLDRLFEVYAFDAKNNKRYYGSKLQALVGDPVVMDMTLEIVLLKYTYPGSGLTPGVVYYWKVQAADGKGGVKESVAQSFTAL